MAEKPVPLEAVCAWIDEMVAMAFDAKRVRRLVIFNAVARQAQGYEDEEDSLRTRLIVPLLEALRRGLDDGSLPAAEPLTDANTIYDLVWSVAHPLRRARSTDHARRRRPGAPFLPPGPRRGPRHDGRERSTTDRAAVRSPTGRWTGENGIVGFAEAGVP